MNFLHHTPLTWFLFAAVLYLAVGIVVLDWMEQCDETPLERLFALLLWLPLVGVYVWRKNGR